MFSIAVRINGILSDNYNKQHFWFYKKNLQLALDNLSSFHCLKLKNCLKGIEYTFIMESVSWNYMLKWAGFKQKQVRATTLQDVLKPQWFLLVTLQRTFCLWKCMTYSYYLTKDSEWRVKGTVVFQTADAWVKKFTAQSVRSLARFPAAFILV